MLRVAFYTAAVAFVVGAVGWAVVCVALFFLLMGPIAGISHQLTIIVQ